MRYANIYIYIFVLHRDFFQQPHKRPTPVSPYSVSIHAPARGATGRPLVALPARTCFNPRPRAGGDANWRSTQSFQSWVSIHAPARGATQCWHNASKRTLFQSTPPRGGRLGRYGIPFGYLMFQSTPPRGGRRPQERVFVQMRSFNPRPRAGGDAR